MTLKVGDFLIKTKLKVILEERGISQKDFVKITRVNKNTINRLYWNTWTRVNRNDINIICNKLDCEVGDIFEHIKEDES